MYEAWLMNGSYMLLLSPGTLAEANFAARDFLEIHPDHFIYVIDTDHKTLEIIDPKNPNGIH